MQSHTMEKSMPPATMLVEDLGLVELVRIQIVAFEPVLSFN